MAGLFTGTSEDLTSGPQTSAIATAQLQPSPAISKCLIAGSLVVRGSTGPAPRRQAAEGSS
jgi:hypothetical protein